MKKETFVKIMTAVKLSEEKANQMEDDIFKILAKYKRDNFVYSGFLYEQLCDLELQESILEILKNEFDDHSEWIEYFVYELAWGSKYEDGWIKDENGNNIVLRTLEDLYDLLIENQTKEPESQKIEVKEAKPITLDEVKNLIEKYLEHRQA